MHSFFVCNMMSQSKSLQVRYDTTYIYIYKRKNYREFDLEGDLVGVYHTWYLSA